MKKSLNLLVILLIMSLFSNAQTEYLQELVGKKCTFLTNVKDFRNIKNVEVKSINESKFEYAKDGSLHDLYFKYIKWIETSKHIYAPNELGRWEKVPKDLSMYYLGDPLKWKSDILISGKDTIRCRWNKFDNEKLLIWPTDGSQNKKFYWNDIDLWVHNGVRFSTSNHIESLDSSFVVFDKSEDQLDYEGKRTKCDIYEVTAEKIKFYIRVSGIRSLKESQSLEKDIQYVWEGNLIKFHSDLNIHVIQLERNFEY